MSTAVATRTILIVEDDRDVRDALSEVLEDYSFRAVTAANGADALQRLRALREKPDLILLDVMMPVMDGWQFRAEQSRDPELHSIPVIVLTAHANARKTAADMGAAGFLKKPVQLHALIEAIEHASSPSKGHGPE